ncbi:MAG: hypothetical protein IJL42_06850 [Bacteroidales bacterium]|nr:hypothetical protein [Bacteroidales bacterium]
MGHKNKESLVKQVQTALESKLRIGESKHRAKMNGTASESIFSYTSFRTYLKHNAYFVRYCKEHYHCRTIEECRAHVTAWMKTRERLSPYTQHLEASAIAKLYGCKTEDLGLSLPERNRDNITRSRGEAVRDKHFSEKNNADLIAFCQGAGPRRNELRYLTRDRLRFIDGKPYIHYAVGTKGGKERLAPIVRNVELIVRLMKEAGPNRVFPKIPSGADIHGYRRDYATAIYRDHARSLEECKRSRFWNPEHFNGKGCPKGGYDRDSVYWMRGSHKGQWLDKAAMMAASQALGHNRISVVGEHYIHA